MKRIQTVNVKTTGMSGISNDKITRSSEYMLSFYQSDFFKHNLLATDVIHLRGESDSSISQRVYDHMDLYDLIMSGTEEWNGEEDYEIDVEVRRYFKRFSKVVGYIVPMKPTIWVNGKFFDSNSIMRIASNLCHEYLHTLGFRHSGKYMKESLPYLVNEWFEEWYREVFDEEAQTITKSKCTRIWWTLWLVKKCVKVIKVIK